MSQQPITRPMPDTLKQQLFTKIIDGVSNEAIAQWLLEEHQIKITETVLPKLQMK